MAERTQGKDSAKQAGRARVRREQGAGRPEAAPPASAVEALERARQHGRAAAVEALCAVRALVDAAALATSGEPAEAHRGLALLVRALDDAASGFGQGEGAALLHALADALDAEIARWEQRATEDADARAVLRAYLGVRELLWELGVRRPASPETGSEKPNGARSTPRANALRRRTGIQRVPLEG